jgi:hypothetical protein
MQKYKQQVTDMTAQRNVIETKLRKTRDNT